VVYREIEEGRRMSVFLTRRLLDLLTGDVRPLLAD